MLALFVILNNYLHDLATGVLFGAAVAMLVLSRRARAGGAALDALRSAYPALTRTATIALVWILVAGVPRTIYFERFEWDPALVKGIVPVLIVKHIALLAAVGAGLLLWRRTRALVRSSSAPAEDATHAQGRLA